MNFPLIDCVVLAAYLIISFVAGICANKILKSSNKSADGYFLAGRSMPGWLTGISNAVTAMNADVAPAYVGVTLAVGLPVCWFYFSRFSLGVLLAGLLFLPAGGSWEFPPARSFSVCASAGTAAPLSAATLPSPASCWELSRGRGRGCLEFT